MHNINNIVYNEVHYGTLAHSLLYMNCSNRNSYHYILNCYIMNSILFITNYYIIINIITM